MMSKLQACAVVGVLLGCWVFAAGCSSDTTDAANDAGTADASVDAASLNISASEFTTSCTVDTDCTAIYEGNACAICACPNAVIASSARDAYQTRFAALQVECGARPAIACSVDCIGIQPHCNAGTCEVRTKADAGTDGG